MEIYHYILLFVIFISILFFIFFAFMRDINLARYLEGLTLGGSEITVLVVAVLILIIIFLAVGFLFSKATKYWYS